MPVYSILIKYGNPTGTKGCAKIIISHDIPIFPLGDCFMSCGVRRLIGLMSPLKGQFPCFLKRFYLISKWYLSVFLTSVIMWPGVILAELILYRAVSTLYIAGVLRHFIFLFSSLDKETRNAVKYIHHDDNYSQLNLCHIKTSLCMYIFFNYRSKLAANPPGLDWTSIQLVDFDPTVLI